MGILGNLFGKRAEDKATLAAPPVTCLHVILLPRWDSIDDMGNEEKVSSYVCESCGQSFSAEEGKELGRDEEARLKRELGTEGD